MLLFFVGGGAVVAAAVAAAYIVALKSILCYMSALMLQIPIAYWLSNKHTNSYQSDFYLFDHLIGEEVATYSQPLNTDNSKSYYYTCA